MEVKENNKAKGKFVHLMYHADDVPPVPLIKGGKTNEKMSEVWSNLSGFRCIL